MKHYAWHGQRVTPNPSQFYARTIVTDTDGAKPATCETANLAMSVYRQGDQAGRRFRGRVAIAGIPTTDFAEGRFVQPTVDAGQLVGNQLIGVITLGPNLTARLGFWSPTHTGLVNGNLVVYPAQFVPCFSSGAKETVRTQRSRTINVGR